MAEIVDSCCVPSPIAGQLTKPDKNNNTTANVDDGIISPSEQSDVIDDGIDGKSESTGDRDIDRLSSGVDDDGSNNNNNNDTVTTETATVASSSSSNDETEVAINNESTGSNNLNANTSTISTDPYKDFSGVDTESFISTTLRNNPKDRTLLLRLENVLQQFIQNEEQTTHQFQAMNSYERMIVHRVAAFFGLNHNVDKNGQAVVVTKTSNTRIPEFSFQKCIPDDESNDLTSGASTTDNPVSSTNSTEMPTRRILRRHEKHPNHEHSQRNGVNDDHSNHQTTTSKSQSTIKPYSERVNHYAETRARIFNDTSDSSNSTLTNKTNKTNNHNNNNTKQHSNYSRQSYRKNYQNSAAHQHRSYTYQHSQQTTHNHMQQYSTGKIIDPSSHMLNTSANRNPSIYSAQQPPSTNLNLGQPAIYASMVPSNPNAATLRPQPGTSFYPQAQQAPVDYDYKQQTGGPHIYNYVSMIPQTTPNFIHQQQQQSQQATQSLHAPSTSGTGPNQVPSQHGTGMAMPILVQQPTGQLQYIFPAHALPQQQQQGQQPPPPSNPYPITPEGQYLPIFRPDSLSISGPTTVPQASVVDNNNTHHHQYPQNQVYHHHPISQQTLPPQQQQPIPPSQNNPNPQPPPFVRLYPTGTPGNVSHAYAQAPYQPPPQTTYVQPGTISGPSYMIPPPQSTGGVQTYPTYDNSIPYNAYGPNTTSASSTIPTAGKSNVNNNGTSVQYATNHLSNLNLQSQHDDYQGRLITNPPTRFSHSNGSTNVNSQRNFIGRSLVQSPNGTTNTPRMTMYSTSNHSYRHNRPGNLTNTDKQVTSIETDSKSLTSTQQQNNSENISLAGPAQE